MKAYVFLAPGFEEGECIDVCDILVRADVDVKLVSITDSKQVTGARGFTLVADELFENNSFTDGEIYYIPGGQPGADNLKAFKPLGPVLQQADAEEKTIASICAGPIVLKAFGLTEGVCLTSHTSVKDQFDPKFYKEEPVVVCGNIFTARGLGSALELGLEIVKARISPERANAISLAIENGPFS